MVPAHWRDRSFMVNFREYTTTLSSVANHLSTRNEWVFKVSALPTLHDLSGSDYAVVIVAAVFLFSSGSWILSARRWFSGPLPNIDIDDIIEKDHQPKMKDRSK